MDELRKLSMIDQSFLLSKISLLLLKPAIFLLRRREDKFFLLDQVLVFV